jgi:SAM-dependent methyltransferase
MQVKVSMIAIIKRLIFPITGFLYRLSTLGMKKRARVTRYYMYRRLAKYSTVREPKLRVLSISGSEQLAYLLGFDEGQVTNVEYPEYNLLNLPFEDGEFDAVVSDQVLEHVEGCPCDAIDESFRVLKKGGISLHTTCFFNPIHAAPNDFWRFTPNALELLAKKHAKVMDSGGWGNPLVWLFCAIGLWSQPIPDSRWHFGHWVATLNIKKCPIVTWVLSEKN